MGYGKEIEIEIDEDGTRRRARLRPRHSAGKAHGLRRPDQHRREVRQRGLQEIRRPQRRRHQGGERALRLLRDPGLARGRDQGARVRQGQAHRGHEEPAARRRSRTARASPSSSDRTIFRAKAKFKDAIRRGDVPVLFLPESGAHAQLQRQEVPLEGRPAGPAARGNWRTRRSIRSSTSTARTSKSPSPTATESGEEYYSFVNGQNTTQGGTHLAAFREALVDGDPRASTRRSTSPPTSAPASRPRSACGCRSRSSNRRRRPSSAPPTMEPDGAIAAHVHRRISSRAARQLPAQEPARSPRRSWKRSRPTRRERKELAGIQKLASESAPSKAKLHNKKLRDCRVHFDTKHKRARGEHALHHRGRLRQRLASPRAATWRRRPSSRCAASRSTPTA